MLVHDGDEAFPFSSYAIGVAVVLDETDVVLHHRIPVLRPKGGTVDMRLKITCKSPNKSCRACLEGFNVLVEVLLLQCVCGVELRLLEIVHNLLHQRGVITRGDLRDRTIQGIHGYTDPDTPRFLREGPG